jgi:hypothetical protein
MQDLFGEDHNEQQYEERDQLVDEMEREEGQPNRKKIKVEAKETEEENKDGNSGDEGKSSSSGEDSDNAGAVQSNPAPVVDLLSLADEAEKMDTQPDLLQQQQSMDTQSDAKKKKKPKTKADEEDDSEFDPNAPTSDEEQEGEEESDTGPTLRNPANSDEDVADLLDEDGVDEAAEARLLAKGDVHEMREMGEGIESEEEDSDDPDFVSTHAEMKAEEEETARQARIDERQDERENGASVSTSYVGKKSKKSKQKGGPLFTSNMQPINEGDDNV